MAKKLVKIIKLQIPAGKANPAPPIGPALGSAGVNIMGFCKEFNAKTQDKAGDVLPVEISVFSDKSFTFITKQPPVSRLILNSQLRLAARPACPTAFSHWSSPGVICDLAGACFVGSHCLQPPRS